MDATYNNSNGLKGDYLYMLYRIGSVGRISVGASHYYENTRASKIICRKLHQGMKDMHCDNYDMVTLLGNLM